MCGSSNEGPTGHRISGLISSTFLSSAAAYMFELVGLFFPFVRAFSFLSLSEYNKSQLRCSSSWCGCAIVVWSC